MKNRCDTDRCIVHKYRDKLARVHQYTIFEVVLLLLTTQILYLLSMVPYIYQNYDYIIYRI